jgi:hypothetical protein
LWKIIESAVCVHFAHNSRLTNPNNSAIDQRLADFQAMYKDKYGSASKQFMLFELGDDLLGFCRGKKAGVVPHKTDTEAERTAHDAWLAEMTGNDEAAQTATNESDAETAKSKKTKKSKKNKISKKNKKSKRTKKLNKGAQGVVDGETVP